MNRMLSFTALAFLCACATTAQKPDAVQRMSVISCGENHVKDLSRWTPGENVGKPYVFGDHCYLIKHAKGWMLWDGGNPDRLAALPNGLTNPVGTITAFMRKPLAESLKEIGVAPADIQHFAMSHSHGDRGFAIRGLRSLVPPAGPRSGDGRVDVAGRVLDRQPPPR